VDVDGRWSWIDVTDALKMQEPRVILDRRSSDDPSVIKYEHSAAGSKRDELLVFCPENN
jgi:hypothetical protein